MPVLKNVRREKFAQELAKGKTQLQAYISAGYKPDDGAACNLAKKLEVARRVQEISGRAAERAEITIASMTQMFLSDRQKAHESKQISAAVSAGQAIMKLHGLAVDRSEIKSLNVSVDLDLLSDDQLLQLQDLLAQAEGAPAKSLPKPESNNDG